MLRAGKVWWGGGLPLSPSTSRVYLKPKTSTPEDSNPKGLKPRRRTLTPEDSKGSQFKYGMAFFLPFSPSTCSWVSRDHAAGRVPL